MPVLSDVWAYRRRRPRFVAVTYLTLVVVAAYPFVDWWLRSVGIASPFGYYDFGAFGSAVQRWEAGEPLYRRTANGGFHGSFLYPPITVLLFVPFVSLGFADGVAAWNLCSLGLLWLAVQMVVDSFGYSLTNWERLGLLWLLVGFHPVLFATKLGQMAPFLTGILSLTLVGLLRERSNRWAGVGSGVGTALVGVVKLAYAPVGAHLLGDRRRFAGAAVTGVALLLGSVLLVGVGPHRVYLDVLAWGAGGGSGMRPPTLWLPGYYEPVGWMPGQQGLIVVAVSHYRCDHPAAGGRSGKP